MNRRAFLATLMLAHCSTGGSSKPAIAWTDYLPGGKGRYRDRMINAILDRAKGAQVIHFGEHHGDERGHELTMALLPQLDKLGYDYFALEADTNEQPLVNAYLDGVISQPEFDSDIRRISGYVEQRTAGELRYRLDTVVPLLKLAHRLHMNIICFDERPCYAAAPDDLVCSTIGAERNRMQFDNLQSLIFQASPHARTIVFGGRFHIDTAPVIYALNGKPTTVLGALLHRQFGDRYINVSLAEDYTLDVVNTVSHIYGVPSRAFLTVPDIAVASGWLPKRNW